MTPVWWTYISRCNNIWRTCEMEKLVKCTCEQPTLSFPLLSSPLFCSPLLPFAPLPSPLLSPSSSPLSLYKTSILSSLAKSCLSHPARLMSVLQLIFGLFSRAGVALEKLWGGLPSPHQTSPPFSASPSPPLLASFPHPWRLSLIWIFGWAQCGISWKDQDETSETGRRQVLQSSAWCVFLFYNKFENRHPGCPPAMEYTTPGKNTTTPILPLWSSSQAPLPTMSSFWVTGKESGPRSHDVWCFEQSRCLALHTVLLALNTFHTLPLGEETQGAGWQRTSGT